MVVSSPNIHTHYKQYKHAFQQAQDLVKTNLEEHALLAEFTNKE